MYTPYLIGLDAGTTSIKGILVSITGEVLAEASREYILETKNNRVELDPEIYWQNTIEVIQQLVRSEKRAAANVAALAFASQGETLICVDKNGKPLRKAIIWLDNRSEGEAGLLVEKIGANKIAAITGQPEMVPLIPATRILWLKNNEKEIFRNTSKFLMVEDYLLYRLTGKFITEPSVSSSTAYLDIHNKTWWDDMLIFMGITAGHLPDILPSGKSAGRLLPNISEITGLHASTIVVTGGYDHACGAIGSGNIIQGMVSETTGTSMAMVVTLNNPVTGPGINLPCQCHVVRDKYFLQPYGQTAGMVLRWFRDEFCKEDKNFALDNGKEVYDLMTGSAASVPAGCGGLIMLPHLAGAGSPEYNSLASGVFEGITLGMGRPYFIRAILESIGYMIRKNLDILASRGINFHEIRALGGAARSPLWNQIKADITGIPLHTLYVTESPALGAAILAGTGAAIFKSIDDGITNMVKVKDSYLPHREDQKNYDRNYNKYLNLYDILKDYWKIKL